MLIEKCPRCGGSLASSTLGSTIASCGQCSGAFMMAKLLAVAREGAPAAPSTIELPPHFREKYALGEPLGRGAMGLVFGGREVATGREVAIKILLPVSEADVFARFLREADLLAAVEHPHLVQVLDLEQLDGHPCLVTEFLGGGTLRDRMKAPMPEQEVVPIVARCLAALEACHGAGIVHRDLKPENILFAKDGTVKVADLGIAKLYGEGDKLTRTGAFIGTPRYMSPEQARGLPATAASDVWGMGVIAYEMLAGERAHDGNGLREVLGSILNQPAPKLDERTPGVSRAVARVIDKALAKKPEDRFASAGQMSLALLRALDPTSGPLATGVSGDAVSSQRRSAIRDSAQRAIKSMDLNRPTSKSTPTPVEAVHESAVTERVGLAAAQPALDTPRAVPPRAETPPARATPAARDSAATPEPRASSGATPTPRPSSGVRRSGPVVRASAPPPPGGVSRAALAGAVGVLLLAAIFAARIVLAPVPGDPRSVRVYPGITGLQLAWTSAEPYAATARASSDGAPVIAHEDGATREHSVTLTGLKEGAAYQVELERGGYRAFPTLRVQLARALELAPALTVKARGPDEIEARVDASVPVSVVSADPGDPSVSVDAGPVPTAPVRLVMRGPGVAAGFLDVKLAVRSVCGAKQERTLRVTGGADRLREYTASTRFVRDLEALDREIVSRRIPVAERELRAETRLKSFPAMGAFTEDLVALQHALTAGSGSLARRFRIYEIVSDLTVMEKLMEARLNVPEPGLSLPRESLVARLVDVRRAAEQLVPALVHIPAEAKKASAHTLHVSAYNAGALASRGPGQDGMKSMVGGLMELTESIAVKLPRGTLPANLERIRLTILGRCMESHVCVNAVLNKTWRLRFFGTSLGIKAGRNTATDFLTSAETIEKSVPRQELILDLPAGLFKPGDNQLELSAQTLVAEMGSNTVFCAPTVHEVYWGPVP